MGHPETNRDRAPSQVCAGCRDSKERLAGWGQAVGGVGSSRGLQAELLVPKGKGRAARAPHSRAGGSSRAALIPASPVNQSRLVPQSVFAHTGQQVQEGVEGATQRWQSQAGEKCHCG